MHTRRDWRESARGWWRRDRLALLLYLLATLLMTLPLALRLDGSWLAIYDTDTYVKLWDMWWMRRVLSGTDPAYYTTHLFYPSGLDLSFHSISWTVTGYALLLDLFLPTLTAYNLTILTAVFTTGYAAYLLLLDLNATRMAAWLGGAVYTFAPYHMTHTGGHPDLTHLAPIPVAALFFLRTFRRQSSPAAWRYAVYTAVTVAVAAYTSLYILIFALLTLLPLCVHVALQANRWRHGRFWRLNVWLGVVTAVLLLPRLWPVLQDGQALTIAIEQKYIATLAQTDLRALITPSYYNPLFFEWVLPAVRQFLVNQKWPAYLGVVPLGLTIVALLYALPTRQRREPVSIWFLTGTMFLLLALGPTLRVNGVVFNTFLMPAAYLAEFPLVRAVARPDNFMMGVLLGLAVCAGLGATIVQRALGAKRPGLATAVLVALSALLLLEFWNGPYRLQKPAVPAFYETLAADTEPFALIDLPLGRQPSKLYVYWQTLHHKPIVEGLSARTPPAAYNYIAQNALLSRWQEAVPLDCRQFDADAYDTAVSRLLQDNFRYVILHEGAENSLAAEKSYLALSPVYADGTITVYTVAEMAAANPCR